MVEKPLRADRATHSRLATFALALAAAALPLAGCSSCQPAGSYHDARDRHHHDSDERPDRGADRDDRRIHNRFDPDR